MAHAEGSIGTLQARLEDALADNEALKQKIGLEQSRVSALGLCKKACNGQILRDEDVHYIAYPLKDFSNCARRILLAYFGNDTTNIHNLKITIL